MNIALTGANGFIGKYLRKNFPTEKFILMRRDDTEEQWKKNISMADVIINLAGSPIIGRWTSKNRKTILESRVNTTRKLVDILNKTDEPNRPKLLISASATGIYPDCKDFALDEYSNEKGDDFLALVVAAWEAEALKLTNPSIRLVIARLGIVLGKEGGMLKTILPVFKSGLGGYLGSGKQMTSFIHIDDLVSAFRFFIDNEKTTGTYNLVSPNPVTNKEFTWSFAKKLHRPVWFHIPKAALFLIFGKASSVLLNGSNVLPKRLTEEGFTFQYPTIQQAFDQLFE